MATAAAAAILFFLLLLFPPAAFSARPNVVATKEAYLPPPPPADMEYLVRLTISDTLHHATITKRYAEDPTRRTSEEALDFYLTICSYAYGVMIDSFTAASKQFEAADYAAAVDSEKNTVQPISDCTFIFTRPPTRTNPLMHSNNRMIDFIHVAVSAMETYLP